MNPPRIVIATHRSLPVALIFTVVLALAAGCVYRPNIQQGNLLKLDDVNQVTVGMTRSQVRYVVGTPMVADPFQPDRWDYIYTLRRGRESKIDRAYFVVYFEGDKVSRLDKVDLPEGTDIEKMRANREKRDAAAAASGTAPPPAPTPEPDGTRPPGG
jgi:outer membrane protein assembly factor BamE